MEVKLGDEIVDTGKMNDIDASLIETSNAFFDVALKFKIPFILRWCNPNSVTFGGASNFNNSSQGIVEALSSLNDYLENELGGEYKLVRVKKS